MTTIRVSEAEWAFYQQCVAKAKRQDEQLSAWREFRREMREDDEGDVYLAQPLEPAADFGTDPSDYWIAMEKRSQALFLLCCERGPQYVPANRRAHQKG